jgi:hypothetical protein
MVGQQGSQPASYVSGPDRLNTQRLASPLKVPCELVDSRPVRLDRVDRTPLCRDRSEKRVPGGSAVWGGPETATLLAHGLT